MEVWIEAIQEMFTTDLQELKRKQAVMNNTITKMKSTAEGVNSRITEAEEWKSELEEGMVEITAEQNKEWKEMGSLRDLQDNIKHNNIQIIRVPKEEKDKGSEKIFEEIIAKNFPNMGKEIATQVHEAQRAPYRIKPRRNHVVTHINWPNEN